MLIESYRVFTTYPMIHFHFAKLYMRRITLKYYLTAGIPFVRTDSQNFVLTCQSKKTIQRPCATYNALFMLSQDRYSSIFNNTEQLSGIYCNAIFYMFSHSF